MSKKYGFIRFFKRFFKSKQNKGNMKSFKIMVYDEDLQDNGTINLKQLGVQEVEARSAKELYNIFKGCGQQIKILEVHDAKGNPLNGSDQNSQQNLPNNLIQNEEHDYIQYDQHSKISQMNSSENLLKSKKKERFYKIGNDVEIKEKNGEIYQKQWVRISSAEMSNYRIVQDTSNKLLDLTGKHLEIKKWVRLESDEDV